MKEVEIDSHKNIPVLFNGIGLPNRFMDVYHLQIIYGSGSRRRRISVNSSGNNIKIQSVTFLVSGPRFDESVYKTEKVGRR